MKVFISWSGPLSRSIAVLLRRMMSRVIQATEPFVSKEIEKGARWFQVISEELSAAEFGIIIITRENLTAPWVMFEAGALAKAMDTGAVTPLLIDVSPSELVGPLVQFQATEIQLDDMQRLFHEINSKLSKPLANPVLTDLLSESYDQFLAAVEEAKSANRTTDQTSHLPSRSDRELLEELLELTRNQERRLMALEARHSARKVAHSIEAPRTSSDIFTGFYMTPNDTIIHDMGYAAPLEYVADQIGFPQDAVALIVTGQTSSSEDILERIWTAVYNYSANASVR
ncbi:MAG: hypothetical protein AAGJ10_21115 [Bacteroidota bacterium]